MSICWIASTGMTLRSNAETPPRTPAGPARRPFKRTRVRFAPRPRSEIVSTPSPPLTTKLLEMVEVICVEPAASGEVCRTWAVLSLPSRFSTLGSMTVSGSALVRSSRRRREPVTTIAPLPPWVESADPAPAAVVEASPVLASGSAWAAALAHAWRCASSWIVWQFGGVEGAGGVWAKAGDAKAAPIAITDAETENREKLSKLRISGVPSNRVGKL
jgi:hypothetical protein